MGCFLKYLEIDSFFEKMPATLNSVIMIIICCAHQNCKGDFDLSRCGVQNSIRMGHTLNWPPLLEGNTKCHGTDLLVSLRRNTLVTGDTDWS